MLTLEELSACASAAKNAWPGVSLSLEVFAEFVRQLGIAHAPNPDLYGVCACVSGDAAAIAVLRYKIAGCVTGATARLKLGTAEVGEIEAKIVDNLLLGSDAKILTYDGRTELKNWLNIIALRTTLNMRRSRHREEPLSDSVLLSRAAIDDPELVYFRELYAAEVKTAFAQALADLPVLTRAMLKSHVLDRLTLSQVGALYGVHTSTASRKLAEAEGDLRHQTLAHLSRRFALQSGEADSIVRLVADLLEQSLARLLAP